MENGERSVLPQRLVDARQAIGLTINEASQKLGFKHYQILSNIEKGSRQINANELIRIAHLYGRDLDYFFTANTSDEPVTLWRKNTDAPINDTKRKFHSFLEKYKKLEALLGLKRRWKEIQKNYFKDDFIENGFELTIALAKDINKQLDLGSRPSYDLKKVLENKYRFKILHMPLENGVSGACVVDDNLGVGILINQNDVPWRRNFDLAHELFHVITWDIFTTDEIGDGIEKTKPELYANIFASSLLLPREHIIDELNQLASTNQIKPIDLIELAIDFKVSLDAITWRLLNLQIITNEQKDEIFSNPSYKKMYHTIWNSYYKSEYISKFPTRYISIACRCLLEGKISRGTFANYLEIDRAEVDDTLTKLGYIEANYEEVIAA